MAAHVQLWTRIRLKQTQRGGDTDDLNTEKRRIAIVLVVHNNSQKEKKMREHKFIITGYIFFTTFAFFCCQNNPVESIKKYPPDNSGKVTINQGVWGNVWFWEGDFMPSSSNSSNGTIKPVIRDIYIYEATTYEMVDHSGLLGAFYRSINSDLVAKIKSDDSGFFQYELQPGTYSFFVWEDSLYYANLLDENGYILPAVIKPDSVTKRQIDITYKACF